MAESLEAYALRKSPTKKTGTLKRVGIVGCGDAGQEIARIICQAGIEVTFVDVSKERNKEIISNIEKQIDNIINKWGLTNSDKRAILTRITGSTDYADLKNCDLIIESVNSRVKGNNLDLRRDVFKEIEKHVSETTVITSNNSTLTISDITTEMKHPERAIGLHFVNPGKDSRIVEVLKGLETNEETYNLTVKFATLIGKKVIDVNESPGAISTRLIVTLINEACETLMEGVATVECVDSTMKLGFGLQFGPFEMADRIGLDKLLIWMDNLYQEHGLHKFKASPIIRRLVRANFLGRRTQKGFYTYDNDGNLMCQTIKIPDFK